MYQPEVMAKIVYNLLQRLVVLVKPCICHNHPFHCTPYDWQMSHSDVTHYENTYQSMYMNGLLVLLLDFEFSTTPDIDELKKYLPKYEETWIKAIEKTWTAYQNKNETARSLFRLCIQRVRRSMINLDDESFQSLAVPSHVRPIPEAS